jgi:hypothetical protein
MSKTYPSSLINKVKKKLKPKSYEKKSTTFFGLNKRIFSLKKNIQVDGSVLSKRCC